MKELSIEEKAKAYDKALERAKAYHNDYTKDIMEEIFPELKESEDEKIRKSLLDYLYTLPNHFSHNGGLVTDWIDWLKSIKDRVQPKQEWSEEDEKCLENAIMYCEWARDKAPDLHCYETSEKSIDLLKSLRPQKQWKPSEEMLEALYKTIPENVMEISEDEILLDKLYQGLKYGRVLSKN